MEITRIEGEQRTPGNRHANERLRARGLVPAVIYGHGQPSETVALSRHDLDLALSHGAHVVALRAGGRETQYLVKDVQYDHLHKTPIHVDLMRFDANERVQVKVPIELRGTPKGCQEGGTLVHILTDLEVECLVTQIPERLRVAVDHLGMNESVHVRDIALPAGVQAVHRADDIVAIVHPPRGTTAEELAPVEAAEGAAEPEVIAKGKEQTEGEEGGE